MSSTGQAAPGSPGAVPAQGSERPGVIDAVPVRHPGRWVAVGVIAILVLMFVHLVLTSEAWNWPLVGKMMIQTPVLRGLVLGTIVGTICAMILGVFLGVVLAVMRLSDNPILSKVAWFFTWFFRAIPRYVLLFIMGSLGILFPLDKGGLSFGIPFDTVIMKFFGISGDMRFLSLDANQIFSSLLGGIIGLGVSEAAYMAEIARAGILSVDPGQREAASALGMSNAMAMRRVVLPQAMRVIVPPTGNETIAMVKDTSLLLAIPVNNELFFQLRAIGSRMFQVFPAAVAATLWYLIICSLLMLVQVQLEKKFGKGFGAKPTTAQQQKAKMLKLRSAGGGAGGF